MPARPLRRSNPIQFLARYACQVRNVLSTFVLAASVTALGLIVHVQNPGWFSHQASQPQLVQDDPNLGEVSGSYTAQAELERNRAISHYLAKRYRVSADVTLDFVHMAFATGHRMGLDPLLILAVMAVESSLNPIAESVAGAKGLMQVIPRYHPEKFELYGGDKAVFEPRANIAVGSQILSEYIQRAGDISLGLRIYGGGPVEGDNPYPAKVLGEKRRLQHVVSEHYRSASRSAPRNQIAL